ncbi:MAG TPA: hypothetical protein VKS60_17395 [Stellaceae bacterium]|nr:hypothetical protein [Stellaceae bacterium]
MAAAILAASLLGCAAADAPSPSPDPKLVQLRTTLLPLRGHADEGKDEEGHRIGPVLMAAKLQLRDWVERRLGGLGPAADAASFEAAINGELDRSDLLCGGDRDEVAPRCMADEVSFDETGFVERIELKRLDDPSHLLLRTAVGVYCGVDESAYLYAWRGSAWRRVWEDEDDVAARGTHFPRHIDDVRTSPAGEGGDGALVLSSGNYDWCSSNIQGIFYGLWRLRGAAEVPTLLVHEEHDAFRTDSFIQTSLGPDQALIEFRSLSLDGGVHSYESVRHFAVSADAAVRDDPIALGPRAFVQEWLENDWAAASVWSAPERSTALRRAHTRFHADHIYGEYLDTTRRCPVLGELWQVGIEFHNLATSISTGTAYFLVRWRPPYRFAMADARTTPDARCTELDEGADQDRTLFP